MGDAIIMGMAIIAVLGSALVFAMAYAINNAYLDEDDFDEE